MTRRRSCKNGSAKPNQYEDGRDPGGQEEPGIKQPKHQQFQLRTRRDTVHDRQAQDEIGAGEAAEKPDTGKAGRPGAKLNPAAAANPASSSGG